MLEDPVERLLSDFHALEWDSKPFERMIEMVQSSSQVLPRLIESALHHIPKGGTYLDAAMSYIERDDFPTLVESALAVLRQGHQNDLSESILAITSMQFPTLLHSHLNEIFELAPNRRSHCEDWHWRESGDTHFAFLRSIIEDQSQHLWIRQKAWSSMLETRDSAVMSCALNQNDQMELPYDPMLALTCVGFETSDAEFRQLYSNQVYHIRFQQEYVANESRPVWLQGHHPTWRLDVKSSATLPFGGISSATCAVCGERLHHIITIEPIPNGIPVSSLNRLELASCLSCLCWEEQNMYYEHDQFGIPQQIGYSGPIIQPQFPAQPFIPTQVQLAKTPERWRWQDWGMSNSRENLHRIGGYPCWIQSPEFLDCPLCNQTMDFLLQLDSELPSMDGVEWLWGSGGICYVCWCDDCKVSGFVTQYT